jgi:hypothetical protein
MSEGSMKIALNMVPVDGFGVQRFPPNLNRRFVFMNSERKNQG